MRLLLLFIAIPILEIALFIQMGGWLGLWPTLALVIFTAILGVYLLKGQGRLALLNLQNSFQAGGNPSKPLAEGAMILIAGVLLLTPGFFTDTIGFCLLTPFIREKIINFAKPHINMQTANMHPGHTQHDTTTVDEDEFAAKRANAEDAKVENPEHNDNNIHLPR